MGSTATNSMPSVRANGTVASSVAPRASISVMPHTLLNGNKPHKRDPAAPGSRQPRRAADLRSQPISEVHADVGVGGTRHRAVGLPAEEPPAAELAVQPVVQLVGETRH